MSAEAFVTQIINQALNVAATKAAESTAFSNQAISASSGSAGYAFTGVTFRPANTDPGVVIPREGKGFDTALFDTTFSRLKAELEAAFKGFFADLFPLVEGADSAYRMLDDMLAGRVGLPEAIQNRIWEADRARILEDARRARESTLATFASRGFPLPPGAAVHAIQSADAEAHRAIARQSSDVAIAKALNVNLDQFKFAATELLKARQQAVESTLEYVRMQTIGAAELATSQASSSADAQAKLISAASSYFNSRTSLEELKASIETFNAKGRLDAGMNDVREFSNRLKARAETLAAAARAAGDQAAAALNAVHASAQVAVQGETS